MSEKLSPTWERHHDEKDAQREAEAFERLEARRASWAPTRQERRDTEMEGLDSSRGRSGLHVKHGVHSEDMPNGNWTREQIWRAETSTGTHYRGRGAEVCPVTAESIFDCDSVHCNHPQPGE